MANFTFYKPNEIPDTSFEIAVVAARYKDKWVFCRHKERDTWDMPGGHREQGETIDEAAKRELWEETGITKEQIELFHLADFNYYFSDLYLEVYVGRVNQPVEVVGDENDLYWSNLDCDFFDMSKYAGEGNIGHILAEIKYYWKQLLKLE